MLLKLAGGLCVVGAAGGYGVSLALRLHRQLRQLRALCSALALLKCEMNYTLLPLPELCAIIAERTEGAVSAFFSLYGQKLTRGRRRAAEEALAESGLSLPNDAAMALLELCGSLGRYDIDGENRLLSLTHERVQTALARTETEKRPLAKSYVVLGLSTGAALVILLI